MPLPVKLHQIPIVLELRIRLSLQTPPRNLDIHPDVLDQSLFADIIVLWPYEAKDEEVHARAVEVLREAVEDVDFLGLRGLALMCVALYDIRGFFF